MCMHSCEVLAVYALVQRIMPMLNSQSEDSQSADSNDYDSQEEGISGERLLILHPSTMSIIFCHH